MTLPRRSLDLRFARCSDGRASYRGVHFVTKLKLLIVSALTCAALSTVLSTSALAGGEGIPGPVFTGGVPYTVDLSAGNFSVTGEITTDGKIGTLGSIDILG